MIIIAWIVSLALWLLRLYGLAVILYTLLSWWPMLAQSVVGRFLERICDPPLRFLDRFLPPFFSIRWSPIALMIIIYFMSDLILNLYLFLLQH